MSWRVYTDGVLIERGDDETRTVYDGNSNKLRDYTAAEHAAADTAQARQAQLTDLAERVARIEAHLWPPAPDPVTPSAPDWASYQGVAPAGALLLDGGKVWRNVSGVPLTEPPSRFVGWSVADLAHLWAVVIDSPDPDPGHPAWEIGLAATPGVTVLAHNGRLWRAKVAHVTHAGWEPGPDAHAVWEDLGPA